MPLGRKGKKEYLDNLETRVRACDAHAPFIDLAEEIRLRAGQQASAENIGDLDSYVDKIVADLTAEQKRQIMLDQLNSMPAETRFKLLAKHFGDKATREAVAYERNRIVRADEKERAIIRMQQEFDDMQRINLGAVPVGRTISIAFYDKEDLMDLEVNTAEALSRDDDYFWDRQLIATSRGQGKFVIVADYLDSGYKEDKSCKLYPRNLDNQTVRLGGNLMLEGEEALDIYYGASMEVKLRGDKPQTLTLQGRGDQKGEDIALGVGYVDLDNIVIMGDRSQNPPMYGGSATGAVDGPR